jgi:dihydrofolate reductase
VVSNSLQSAEWQNSEIISGDVAQKITDLKAQDGGDIAMSGSPTTVRSLLRQGLVDELNLLIHPIAVGGGMARLFPPDEQTIRLELLSAQTFKTGVLNLSYAPAKD